MHTILVNYIVYFKIENILNWEELLNPFDSRRFGIPGYICQNINNIVISLFIQFIVQIFNLFQL